MFAVVDIAGQQFKVAENQTYYVPRLSVDAESEVTFDNVLVLDNDKEVKFGSPSVKGVSVKAKVLEHLKDDKILVFKKKRRKGYQKLNGHRHYLTKIEILSIG